MISEIPIRFETQISRSTQKLLDYLREIRSVTLVPTKGNPEESALIEQQNLLEQFRSFSTILSAAGHNREAEVLIDVHALSILPADFGGLGLKDDRVLNEKEESQAIFLVSAWLESLNSADRSKRPARPLTERPKGRRGMTLSEKILAAHDIEGRGELKPGDMVRVNVDWIMASELSWNGMEQAYNSFGKPGIFRNDRFWLAGDHVVDPRIKENPKVKALVAASERARDGFRMTEYQGMNYTIMHTEFFRERAQPGDLIIGSDSHTCSAGSLGCLAIGLGVSDVTIPLITGETWFKVPETVNIRLINTPSPGIGGKDTILYIMKELKRNTIASDRIVEFTGPGVEHLSCDARFAIANMTTEFGGITGIFVPDQVTYDFVNHRKLSRNKKNSKYFRADPDAVYVSTHVINLAKVESFVALYPSPDDVVPVSKIEGTPLDGCFIGACTTAEEDLIIGAMVLEIGLKRGLVPVPQGKRRVVPGSLPILNQLRSLGFVDIYEKAGFVVGVPGCSYCVGMGADKAGEGEVWISSQNRNFENRMGKGSIGNLASAATVAASSFDMKVTDPSNFLNSIDRNRLREALGHHSYSGAPRYVEPSSQKSSAKQEHISSISPETQGQPLASHPSDPSASLSDVRRGKIQRLGNFIDTDALAPAEALTSCKTDEEFGQFCLIHTHPDFRERAKQGYNIVVAGTAFGCGSSRENAVNALLGTGVICVIAKSFAFIYGRNQPNLGLLGITITDESFYDAAADGEEVVIDLARLKVRISGQEWDFELSPMERELIEVGGLTSAFKKFGKGLFNEMCTPKSKKDIQGSKDCASLEELKW